MQDFQACSNLLAGKNGLSPYEVAQVMFASIIPFSITRAKNSASRFYN